jgi:hypothetical protein
MGIRSAKREMDALLEHQTFRQDLGSILDENPRPRLISPIRRKRAVRGLGLKLISDFNLDGIMDLLARELPGLGISECCISLFENPGTYRFPEPAPEWSTCIMAYDEKGRIPLESEGLRFPTRLMIPDSLWNEGKAKCSCDSSLPVQRSSRRE